MNSKQFAEKYEKFW